MSVEWKEQTEGRDIRRKMSGYSNLMLVRVFGFDERGREPYGEILHLNLLRPVPYQGLAELGFRTAQIARYLNLLSDRYSSLESGEGKANGDLPEEYCKVISASQRARYGFLQGMHLKKALETVSVELLGREHKSLQGRLRCSGTKGNYRYFRSGLEMVQFISEALTDEKKIRLVEETLKIE